MSDYIKSPSCDPKDSKDSKDSKNSKDFKDFKDSPKCCEPQESSSQCETGADQCHVHVHIKHVDTINIFNCSKLANKCASQRPTQTTDYSDCIPFSDGHKSKQNLQNRLRNLYAHNTVPSVLAAVFINQAKRYLAGAEPDNELEQKAFSIFSKLPSSTLEILTCLLEKLDADRQIKRLFSPEIEQIGNASISLKKLTALVANELVQRTSVFYFNDPDCFDTERPGLLRQSPQNPNDDAGSPIRIHISAVDGLRTNQFFPQLSLGQFRSDELQQVCTPEIQNGTSVVLNCTPLTANCPGNDVDGVCLRVPEVSPGDAVLLQGSNFFNIDGKVRLVGKAPSEIERDINAIVCGDVVTELTETINGENKIINDHRVQDQILFTIPTDMPAGIYGVFVVMPLNNDEVLSQQQFVRVVPPAATTYQISSEQLKAVSETSPAWLGSDEVGIKVLTTAISLAGEIGTISSNNFKFGNVDSGDTRDMARVLFQQNNIASVVVTIIGHEIDNDELYEKEVEAFEDAFTEILKSNWAAISGSLGTTGAAGALALGLSSGWAFAIGGAITLAINLLVAYIGRADLIIEDTLALNALNLDSLTNANFPIPEPSQYVSPGGIEVESESLSKDIQYLEKRTYESDDEGSKYVITLRYNRVQ